MAKKASAKKRTAAQKRATAKLVAMNKKKRASKKKASARKKRTTHATPRRRPTTRVRGYPGGARRTNPVKGANQWNGSHHVVCFIQRNKSGTETKWYFSGLQRDGETLAFSPSRNAAALLALGSAQNILYVGRKKMEAQGYEGHMEIDSYHFMAWN